MFEWRVYGWVRAEQVTFLKTRTERTFTEKEPWMLKVNADTEVQARRLANNQIIEDKGSPLRDIFIVACVCNGEALDLHTSRLLSTDHPATVDRNV